MDHQSAIKYVGHKDSVFSWSQNYQVSRGAPQGQAGAVVGDIYKGSMSASAGTALEEREQGL